MRSSSRGSVALGGRSAGATDMVATVVRRGADRAPRAHSLRRRWPAGRRPIAQSWHDDGSGPPRRSRTAGTRARIVLAEDPRVSARPSSQRRPGDFPDLRAVAYVARRGWWAIRLAAVACAVFAEAAGSRGEVRYEASTGVLIGPTLGDPAQVRAAEARVPTYAQLATSGRVVRAA